MANLNQKLSENNSELENSKEKISNNVTIGSKIIRALQIIRDKKLILNVVLCNKYFSGHDLWALYCL